MNELISQLWTPELTAGFIVVVVLLLILYVLSIVWVVRDAYMRGTQWYIWAIVALVPGVGLIAYLLLRPPLLQIDRDEQELEIALKQRELMRYGECATCGYPVEADYVLCPNCLTQLKNLCRTCHKALDPAWEVCPYCATPVMIPGHRHDAAQPGAMTPATQAAARPAQSADASPFAKAEEPKAAPRPAASPDASQPSDAAAGDAKGQNAGAQRPAGKRSRGRGAKGAGAAVAKPADNAGKTQATGQTAQTASGPANGSAPGGAQKNNPRAAKKAQSKG